MASRACLGCGRLIASGSRCGRCSWKQTAAYSPRMRGRRWMRLRAAVLRNAGWVCQQRGDRIASEVHHLHGLEDNQMESLLAVCVDCHRELERAKRAASGEYS